MSIIREVDLETGKTTDREMTTGELAVAKRDKELMEKREAANAQAAADKASATAKLAALGLTAEDLTALGL